jgi:hypothetical protein
VIHWVSAERSPTRLGIAVFRLCTRRVNSEEGEVKKKRARKRERDDRS